MSRCPICAGQDGRHTTIHRRHPAGGGGANVPCPNTPTKESTVKTAPGHTCPRCGGGVPNDLDRGKYPGALSRLDNETEICSGCGQNEAMFNLQHPGQPLPPVTQPVFG